MRYWAIVSLSAELSAKSYSTWTEPLPKVRSPMITARSRFLSAPATISEAEADPLLTSTAIGSSDSVPDQRARLGSRSLLP